MLSLPKKLSDKQSAVAMPSWHPNFRIKDRLPDTKAIRTSFGINALAVFIVMSLIIYVGYREYGLYVLKSETQVAINGVQGRKPVSDRTIILFKKFQEEEKKVFALQSFLSPPEYTISDLMLKLGESLPPAITLSTIDCKTNQVTLRGAIQGAPDEATGLAVLYVEGLRSNTDFTNLFSSITLSNIVRDPGTGFIQFLVDLKFKDSIANPKGRKK